MKSESRKDAARFPSWVRSVWPADAVSRRTRDTLVRRGVHTVCEEAGCPNRGRCYSNGTATFMILGDRCTRRCSFCAVGKGEPESPDSGEALRVADAARDLGLSHVVITSVTRDDLPDGGAGVFAETIQAVRRVLPESTIEILVPDFLGNREALARVLSGAPQVLNHNLETVPRLYPGVRPGADYQRSLSLLETARVGIPEGRVKSGLMVGLGESREEMKSVMRDLANAGCSIVTVGQYLRPSRTHHPVERYLSPSEFDAIADEGKRLGIPHVIAGPMVRSSFLAGKAYRAASGDRGSATSPEDKG